MGIAVSQSATYQLYVSLLGTDATKARTAAHDVDEHSGYFRAHHVGEPFQHQAETRGAGEGHTALSGTASAVHHVDRGDLANRLYEDAIQFGQHLGHQFGPLGGRCDRIAKEMAASSQDRPDCRRVCAFDHKRFGLWQWDRRVGPRLRFWCIAMAGTENGRGVHQLESSLVSMWSEAEGFRASRDAKATAIAVSEIQNDRYQSCLGVDLDADGYAALWARQDAASTSLAVLRYDEGLWPLDHLGHATTSCKDQRRARRRVRYLPYRCQRASLLLVC